jgi:hypothetical protein
MTSVLGGRRELWTSLLVGLCCLLVYNANGRGDQRRRHLSGAQPAIRGLAVSTPSSSIRSRR